MRQNYRIFVQFLYISTGRYFTSDTSNLEREILINRGSLNLHCGKVLHERCMTVRSKIQLLAECKHRLANTI